MGLREEGLQVEEVLDDLPCEDDVEALRLKADIVIEDLATSSLYDRRDLGGDNALFRVVGNPPWLTAYVPLVDLEPLLPLFWDPVCNLWQVYSITFVAIVMD